MVKIQNGKKVTLEEIRDVANGDEIHADEQVYKMLDKRRAQITAYIKTQNEPAYGFNRGFGHNVDLAVDDYKLWGKLQENLILSHACGMGDPVPVKVVRATMFLRAISLAKGNSAVRSDVVKTIITMLNKKIIPEVPRYGSVGASGDLAPMSHIALGMIGRGYVSYGENEERTEAGEAFKKSGTEPIQLEMKEGLALNNGIQFSAALGILSYFELKNLLKTAVITTAITTQVMLGSDKPFRKDLHELRPHDGAMKVAGWIRELLKGSPIRETHEPYQIDGEIQDPYNIRCAGQILGTCRDLIEEARKTLETEANSVTDNPLILPDKNNPDEFTEIVSGGHFHGMPVAVKLYNFMQAMGIMSRLSNMRCARYVDEARNKGLGSDLKWHGLDNNQKATCSGIMISEYTSAALTNLIWGACMPIHLFSLSTDAGQEDHVSMSAGLGARVWETIPRLADILAIELAMGTQAASVRKTMDYIPSKIKLSEEEKEKTKSFREGYERELKQVLKERFEKKGEKFRISLDVKLEHVLDDKNKQFLSKPCEEIVDEIMKIFPTVKEDRYMAEELKELSDFVLSGKLVEIADKQNIFET
ncbi:MAG: aromatic amino acid lyase [Desulfobacterales bacterium]|nr:aromatic amino acid lyase [Desulfobacterales bacterium]